MENEFKKCFESGTPRDMFGHLTSDDIGIDSRDFVTGDGHITNVSHFRSNVLKLWPHLEPFLKEAIQKLPKAKFYCIIGVTFCVFALIGFAIGFGKFSLFSEYTCLT